LKVVNNVLSITNKSYSIVRYVNVVFENSLNKSLRIWRLEHIIQLHSWSHYLLFLRIVSSMLRSFFPGHIKENDEPDQRDKEHPPRHRGDDETGQLVI